MSLRLVRLLLRLLASLPLPLNHALGAALGLLAMGLGGKMRRVARLNLDLAFPDLDETARRRLLRASFRELGKTALELGPIWYRPLPRLERRVFPGDGVELLEQAVATGRGLIVAVPHLGAWELMAPYYGKRLPLHTLYRPPRRTEMEPLLRELRERAGGRVHPADAGGIRSLARALRQGEVVAILPDQKPRGSGVQAPFFGAPAQTMTLISRLAQRSNAAVLFGFAERLPRGRGYRMRFLPAPEAVRDPDPEVAASAINQGVEQCIRQAPAQYQWIYKRYPDEHYRR